MVESAATPRVSPLRRRVLRAARALTNPLLPDDYLALLNPKWSTRELTGTVERVVAEADGACTVVVRPDFPWPGHRSGQYLRIGAEIDGIRRWRAYSLTSDPGHPDGLLGVTVKHVPDGEMSPWFTRRCRPGTQVLLGAAEGEFGLPDQTPERILMITAGSGITPVFALLRELERRGALHDVVHLHGTRTAERFIFGPRLRDLARRHRGYRLHEQISSSDGRLRTVDLDRLVPDWRGRATFLSGPREMIDVFQEHWKEHGDDPALLRTERFQPVIGEGDGGLGEGGSVRFLVTDVEATCDAGVSILVGGERAGATLPHGCRMGICHTCVGKLRSGRVRDLRSGEVHGEEGQTVRTCVNAPEGHVEIEL
ncbi:ferredoxin reductase [Patulibacter defluvii]|uniref:ferredoxin reductase n=1 Tax=Patulibacter defluvii TaxID=3095358 RepID=UPI002A763A8E|nr:ferredoxin reductase [Patulibacter sp. DM4]